MWEEHNSEANEVKYIWETYLHVRNILKIMPLQNTSWQWIQQFWNTTAKDSHLHERATIYGHIVNGDGRAVYTPRELGLYGKIFII